MNFDVCLKGGLVVDGSGEPGFVADLGIADGKIAAIGDLSAAISREAIDCKDRVVSPGFIDVHTHYDAQVLWDPTLSPSDRYGVTTVLMGNCGLSLAPTKAEDRDACVSIFESVEAMQASVLEAGVPWKFEGVPEYLDMIKTSGIALNVATLVGQSMLRLFVMGAEAYNREVTTVDERAQMKRLLAEAIDAGAFGFSCSKQPSHVDGHGRPIPGRVARLDEFFDLADTLGELGAGFIQANRGPQFGIPEIAELATRSGASVTWTTLRSTPNTEEGRQLLRETIAAQESGAELWPQVSCVPAENDFTLANPYMLLENLPSFGELAGAELSTRILALKDPTFRKRAASDMERRVPGQRIFLDWERITVVESAAHPDLQDLSLAQLAIDEGRHPFDVMADIALADDLQTHFAVRLVDFDEEILGEFLESPHAIIGLSDAGAHASQLCGSSFGCQLLGHWVRERKQFPLEFAVWRLTGQLADALHIADRGRLKVGLAADVCVFDPDSIAQGTSTRVFDLPAGGDRLIRAVTGIENVLVNGEFVVRGGSLRSARSGRLLSSQS